ncbi:hypothetical protein F511_45570 [Dorcoceras hygrometricum]|uniref:Uncharacterized protein n=1 Tax=Dorcoceras hygrometricum TaxID=472368 RepID=A0A2Z7A2U2_9LAMI|nr:hypothetical protein F511_45570 [Dorcoceras hygrometricum]
MPPGGAAEEQKQWPGDDQYDKNNQSMTFIGRLGLLPCWQLVPGSDRFRKENGTSRTRRPDEVGTDGFSSSNLAGTIFGERRWWRRRAVVVAAASDGGGAA